MRITLRRKLCVASFLTAAFTGGAPHVGAAAPAIFWTDSAKETVERSDLDGASVQVLVSSGLEYPEGIALDIAEERMYWADGGQQLILSAPFDGFAVDTLIAGIHTVAGIALDTTNGMIYWTDVALGRVHRAGLDGTGAEMLLESPGHIRGIALDVPAGKLYFTGGGNTSLQRANLDGTALETLLTSLPNPVGIALDPAAGRMYWTDDDAIHGADLDGSNVEDLAPLQGALGLAVDAAAGKLYWTRFNSPYIRRSDLDGGNVEDLVTTGPIVARALAIVPAGAATGVSAAGPSFPAGPASFARPNPFARVTRIHFLSANAGRRAVTIHDVRGRLVRTLGFAPRGESGAVVEWDGRNDGGVPASDGVYFARRSSPAGGETVRLVLLR